MSNGPACPEPWELKLLALGMISAGAALTIKQHLGECQSCRVLFYAEPDRQQAIVPFPFLDPPVDRDEIGRLGNYRVLRFLDSGGMGIVFHAEDLALRRAVALKVLKPDLEAEPTSWQRFLREARLLAAIKHEHVVTVFDVGQAGQVVYLAMELLQGQSLAALLASGRLLPVSEILRVGREVAGGLAAIHRHGLVHRDIKPANIWLEAASPDSSSAAAADVHLGRVKILDLGLARPIQDDARLTNAGMIVGTPAFMSPEQADGGALDVRSDLFSLGCVLSTLCTGAVPALHDNTKTQLAAPEASDPRPLREANPAIPPGLAELVQELLADSPEKRPSSAREVIARLQQLDTAGHPVAHPHLWAETRKMRPEPGARPASARAARWRRWAGVVLGLGLLGGLLLAGMSWGLSGRPATADAEQRGQHSVPGGASLSPVAGPLQLALGGKLPKRFTNALGIEFVLVPKGKFWMGGRGGELVGSEVEIPHDFYLGVYEVTQEEWQKVMGWGSNPSRFARTGGNREEVQDVSDEELLRFPVHGVSWEDCQEFLSALNNQVKDRGWVYRLPREAEWEYACRGGPSPNGEAPAFDFYAGNPTNTLAPDCANFAATGLKRPCKVGSYAPNRLGLFDMHGNVFEVCDDLRADGAGEPLRVLRGGGWLDPAEFCRAWSTNVGTPSSRYDGSGLRLALVAAGN